MGEDIASRERAGSAGSTDAREPVSATDKPQSHVDERAAMSVEESERLASLLDGTEDDMMALRQLLSLC
jgi:hypothetical protein